MKNPVAKNMNTFNRSSVVPHKRDMYRDRYLDELAESEREYEPELDEEWNNEDYNR